MTEQRDQSRKGRNAPVLSPSRGFTLVEVLISIAIALVLILGISEIFSIAQRTTGGGTTVLAATETNVSAQSVFKDDFRTMANGTTDSPGLVIVSYSLAAWRNQVNKQQDSDADPTTMNDPAGSSTPIQLYAPMVNSQIHRLDRMCFFARDRFPRQTSSAPGLVSSTTSNEAFIWIGHLSLPTNDMVKNWNNTSLITDKYQNPGDTTSGSNDNNLYASAWILGREVILLSPSPTDPNYYVANPDPLSLLPLPTVATSNDSVPIYSSRYDLAQTSIAGYRTYIGTNNSWWEDVSGVQLNSPPNSTINMDQRYEANPFLVKPPSGSSAGTAQQWMSAAAAQTYPIFVRGCSQFIVEFAGDFVGQDVKSGQITSAKPDGQIDFTIDPTTGTRQIRWYGFPRDPNDQGKIGVDVGPSGTDPQGVPIYNEQYGVCPLRDTQMIASNYVATPSCERNFPTNSPMADYSKMPATPGTAQPTPYLCAWGPDTDGASIPRPKMIRITMAVDDPAGHLNAEQTYVYVFNLP